MTDTYAIRARLKEAEGKTWPYLYGITREDIAYLLARVDELKGHLIQANKDQELLTEQRDAARRKLAEAWYEGVDAALERRTQLTNPYLPPGEDGPR